MFLLLREHEIHLYDVAVNNFCTAGVPYLKTMSVTAWKVGSSVAHF